ncbi:putative uncharacterized protein [Prevotella sp. CAG:755]|nr:putative uncharacterized protein [Prevotella sp. CAG:755]
MVVDTVQHHGHVAQLVVRIQALDVGQLATVEPAGTHHEQRQVGDAVGDARVGDQAHGDVVGHHVVIARAELRHQGVEALVHQQLGGVRGHRAGRHDVEGFEVLDHVVHRQGGVCQIVRHADVPGSEVARQRPLADVEVEKHHTLLRVGQAQRKVARHERLARALVERGEGHHLLRRALAGHEGHVRPKHAEGLRHRAAAVGLALGQVGALALAVVGDRAQEGHRQSALDLLAAAHARVHEQDAQENHAREEQAGQDAQGQHTVAVRGNRARRAVRAVDHARVVVRHRLRQRVLLTLVQQVEVEALLDLLLTLDGEHLALLAGDRQHAALRTALAGSRVLALHVKTHNQVVDRADDALLH